jgi:hypothetical protein
MKSYLIDEISSSDLDRIRDEMEKSAGRSGLEKLFWIEIPENVLSENQLFHKECGPHVLAVELGRDWIRYEFFVRALKDMKCSCNGYATTEQIHFAMEHADRLLERLGVKS